LAHPKKEKEGTKMSRAGLTRSEQVRLRTVLESVATDLATVLDLPVEVSAVAASHTMPLHMEIVSRKPARL
jgi:hypothetical protein